ncbi:hypothetical protein P154DRAFT_580627 [Amniculicola lignicola CBS 123094]|uniref:Uncharacterized protein n=1 Tax=Amniculicola lignicola CBS 123094 TaxID=1392246 RepID=A0A6A5W9G8_9PLEO|nr:hypothetical protein P154DRAFT_580627 [Amniculicola lignicola CBS 123094]
MPIAPKSYAPALAAFLALSFTYVAVVAKNEGAQMDGARARWQQQMHRGNKAMSDYGASLMEPSEEKQPASKA